VCVCVCAILSMSTCSYKANACLPAYRYCASPEVQTWPGNKTRKGSWIQETFKEDVKCC